MGNREELKKELVKNFRKDVVEGSSLLSTREEDIYYVKALLDLLKKAASNPDLFDVDDFINQNLLEKFRTKMVPFVKCSVHYYFMQGDFYQLVLFKKLKIEEITVLDHDDFEDLLNRYFYILEPTLRNLYLKEPQDDKAGSLSLETSTNEIPVEELKNKMPWFNRNRQALMLHYLLDAEGITRNEVDISNMARFAHSLLGWDYTKVHNTELYKRLKNPFNKDNKLLLEDLEFVKTQFELIKHNRGVELIKKEIDNRTKK